MPLLEDQTALITGTSSGIGAAVAKSIAAQGATVAINYASSHESAAEIFESIKADGGKAIAIQADIGQEDQVKALLSRTINAYGTIDILVNNAGIQKDTSFIDITLEQ